MNSGTIDKNQSNYYGGGIYVTGGSIIMNGGTISNNTAPVYGGGLYLQGGAFTLNGGSINKNTSQYGGGVFNYNATATINAGDISENHADYGGGIYSWNSKATMNGGHIEKNIADIYGGGIYLAYTTTAGNVPYENEEIQTDSFIMNGGSINQNIAKSNGGGLFLQHGTQAKIYAGELRNNIANGDTDRTGANPHEQGYIGAAAYVNGGKGYRNAELYLTNVLITDNSIENTTNGSYVAGGGGIAGCPTSWSEILQLNGGLIYGNQANGSLHDIYVRFDLVILKTM